MTPEQQEIARLKCVLLVIRDVASGEHQMSHDDAEKLLFIHHYINDAFRVSPNLPQVEEATIAKEAK